MPSPRSFLRAASFGNHPIRCPGVRHAIVNVRMHVDQPRCHELALRIENVTCVFRRHVSRNTGNLRAAHCDVAHSRNGLRRIDYAPALYDEIVTR